MNRVCSHCIVHMRICAANGLPACLLVPNNTGCAWCAAPFECMMTPRGGNCTLPQFAKKHRCKHRAFVPGYAVDLLQNTSIGCKL